jgi:hypothetical protein
MRMRSGEGNFLRVGLVRRTLLVLAVFAMAIGIMAVHVGSSVSASSPSSPMTASERASFDTAFASAKADPRFSHWQWIGYFRTSGS